MAMDSQIRCTTLRVLNKLQTFIDLSRSPYVPDQFEQSLLELLKNETILHVLDEVVPLAAKFQHRNHRFIDGSSDFFLIAKSNRCVPSFSRQNQFAKVVFIFGSAMADYLMY